jgi:thiol-disulfide isomerase/thioredoxin
VRIAVDGQIVTPELTDLTPGSLAPNFQYTLPDGTIQQLHDLQGQRVIVNFWATYCHPCREEMVALDAVATRYPDVTVIGVNRGEAVPQIQAFIKDVHVSFPLIENSRGDIWQQYRLSGVPVTYFLNRDSTIQRVHVGILDAKRIDDYLKATH